LLDPATAKQLLLLPILHVHVGVTFAATASSSQAILRCHAGLLAAGCMAQQMASAPVQVGSDNVGIMLYPRRAVSAA
jgi:hypothetical protein